MIHVEILKGKGRCLSCRVHSKKTDGKMMKVRIGKEEFALCYYCLLKGASQFDFFITAYKDWQAGTQSEKKIRQQISQFKKKARRRIER